MASELVGPAVRPGLSGTPAFPGGAHPAAMARASAVV